MLNMYSFYYFLWLICIPVIIYTVYYVFRNRSDRFKYWFIFSLTILAWIVHFSRYWLDPEFATYKLFFVDLCGFSTMLYPFLMLLKNKVLKDYMYYLGGLFAFLSLAYPNTIDGDPVFIYNTIRFFSAHVILMMVPILLVAWKLHTPNIKNIGWMFILLMIGAIYNMALTSFFVEVGLRHSYTNYMGIWGQEGTVYSYALVFAPWLTYEKLVAGEIVEKAIPFFYIIPAAFIILMPTWVLMSFPFLNFNKIKLKFRKIKII